MLEPGKRGEICVRGPRLMNGYLGKPKATAESFIDGWLATGDVGIIDQHDRVFVIDRQKVQPLLVLCARAKLIQSDRISSKVDEPN